MRISSSFLKILINWETLKVIQNARLKNSKSTSKWDVISKNLPNIFRKNDEYHSECYKKYTAYNISAYITEEEVESKVSLRSSTTPCSSKSSGVLEPVCLFCNKKRKKFKGRWLSLGSCEKFDVEISIREAANKLEDENIKRKIGNYKYKDGPDFIALEVKYHHECKREYLNKVRNTKSNSTSEQSMYNIRKST